MVLVLARSLIFFVALLHFGFMWLEMVLWTKPLGQKIFRNSEAFARQSAALAANQGLYNGFLAAGLLWSLLTREPSIASQIAIFFLVCVAVAGGYGAYSVSRRIFFLQALPALIALLLIVLARVIPT